MEIERYVVGVCKQDARNQSFGELHELSKQLIRLDRIGHKLTQIVEVTGLFCPTVRTAIDLYGADGATALKPMARGKQQGKGRTLTPSESPL